VSIGDHPIRRVSVAVPARVNLIGEHTDYNGGAVLPAALPIFLHVTLAPRAADRVTARTGSVRLQPDGPRLQPDHREWRVTDERPRGDWTDYIQGVVCELRRAGHAIRGFDITIDSDIPPGSGLASSAALQVAAVRALAEAFAIRLDPMDLARLVQRAENTFVGAPVGIMDPVACVFGEPRSALHLDTRTLRFERVPLPASLGVVVIDSGSSHAHATGEYRKRREQCEAAARALRVTHLAALDAGTAPARDAIDALPAPLDRRARHVVTEHARVGQAVAALRAGDLARFGALVDASHASLRDDFEVSTPDIDRLVSIARGTPGVLGARITGGGFGGSVLVAVEGSRADQAGAAIVARYNPQAALPARVVV
jgi:galactokinase